MKTIKFLLSSSLLGGIMALLLVSCKPTVYDTFGTIYGTVRMSDTNEPIEGALVTLSPGAKTYMTLADGSFVFEELEIMQYTLTVQKTDYSTNRKSITPVAGESVEATILLSPRK